LEYRITAHNGDSVRIEAQNWMVAMGRALPFFGLETLGGTILCTQSSAGIVRIHDEAGKRSWELLAMAPKLTVIATSQLDPADEETEEEETITGAYADVDPPTIEMPSMPGIAIPVPLAERLFELSGPIAMAGPDEACRAALELLVELVEVEAASIVRGTLNDEALTFVAVYGPVSDQLRGRHVAFGRGLVGQCFDMGGTLIAHDVQADTRHLAQVDEDTGFVTSAALCSPIVDDLGMSYGVVQLLNPSSGRFEDRDVEIVETVSRTLASALGTG